MFNIGEVVYFKSANGYHTGLYKGTVIDKANYVKSENKYIIPIDNVENIYFDEDSCYGTYMAWEDECFYTKEGLERIINSRKEKIISDYCDSIKTIEDLVKFPITNPFGAEEYTDYEAIEAYKIMAKKLLNIDI